jgi:hypothetical protein
MLDDEGVVSQPRELRIINNSIDICQVLAAVQHPAPVIKALSSS